MARQLAYHEDDEDGDFLLEYGSTSLGLAAIGRAIRPCTSTAMGMLTTLIAWYWELGHDIGEKSCDILLRDLWTSCISTTGFEKPSATQQMGIIPFCKVLNVIQGAQSGTGNTTMLCAGISKSWSMS
ncbi:hypothetical protein Ancab_014670 [Ancistrocladus abbreviatus]